MSYSGRSYGSGRSRRSGRAQKNTVNEFQMFIVDAETGDYITPEKVDAPSAPKRYVLVVAKDGEFKVKVKIFPGAWDHDINAYDWYQVQLLIDGQHISRRFLQRPFESTPIEFTFDSDPLGRPFIFDTRHDGTEGPSEHIEDEDEVGQIKVRFRRAETVRRDSGHHQHKRRRRNHDFHKDNQFNIREASKKRMDIQTKEKKSTMRTVFGKSTRERPSGRRGGSSGGGPPARVVHGEDDTVVAECSTMYDSAAAFELRNWINPLLNEKFRKYFPNRNFDREMQIYSRNQKKITAVCDLTLDEDEPLWDNLVKDEGRRTHRSITMN